MVVYGYNSSLIGHHKDPNLKCPTCNSQNTVAMHAIGKYATLFWIPMFPIGKKIVGTCENCNTEIPKKQFPSSYSLALQTLKDTSKRPIWHYSGIGLLLVIVLFFYINDLQHKKDVVEYISTPLKGDIYDIKLEDGDYTLYSVQAVTEDSVFVYMNDYKTNYKTGLDEIDQIENYSTDVFGFSKLDIKTLYDTKHIIDVTRD